MDMETMTARSTYFLYGFLVLCFFFLTPWMSWGDQYLLPLIFFAGAFWFAAQAIERRVELEAVSKERSDSFKGSDYLIVFGLTALAIFIRMYNLDYFDHYIDEYYTAGFIRNHINGNPSDHVRLGYVSKIAALFCGMYDCNDVYGALMAGRTPLAIFGGLCIIPLYLLGKLVSRTTALIACLLFILSPYAIHMARFLQEYSITVFLFLDRYFFC